MADYLRRGILLRYLAGLFFALACLERPLLAGELGFEGVSAGPFESIATELGRWSVRAGVVEIDAAHARQGTQCLHLEGGVGEHASALELNFAAGLEVPTLFTFWAERWTKRDPFQFSVQAFDGSTWREVYDGSQRIEVGGFRTQVELSMQKGDSALRFACQSPIGTGVLIDDVALVPAQPMKMVAVTISQPCLPVLVGNPVNPLLRVRIQTEGSLQPLELAQLTFDLKGTSEPGALARAFVVRSNAAQGIPEPQGGGQVFASTPDHWKSATDAVALDGGLVLSAGVNDFWVCVELKPQANIDGWVDAHLLGLRIEGQMESIEFAESTAVASFRQRMGVALRKGGDDGVPVFRIPGLVTTPKGTLIGVYDVRWKGWGDLPGDIDVGLSRSTDGGRHWEPMRVMMDMGNDPEWSHDGVGDPALLVDRNTGRIFVIATWSHGQRSWRGSLPGLAPAQTGQLMLVHSDDEGLTWSKPRNLTRMVKDPEWSFLLQGPGRGICMENGTLVFPAQFLLSPEEGRLPYSSILWSADHGETWKVGTGILSDTTESAVVELSPGLLMSNQRNNRGGSRSVFTSGDMGATWAEHASSRLALREPVCMGSLIHVGRDLGGPADRLLLFSNPDVQRAPRRHMSIKASRDLGESWPAAATLLLDEGKSAGYSCLSMIDAETVGILYEGSRAQLTFQRVPLTQILKGDEANR
ncbi:MAG: sialidase-1 [Candidatus Paceibacteria bacterium]|jgi:sialidase-1